VAGKAEPDPLEALLDVFLSTANEADKLLIPTKERWSGWPRRDGCRNEQAVRTWYTPLSNICITIVAATYDV